MAHRWRWWWGLGVVLLLAGCAGSGYYNDKGQWVGTDVAGALTRPDPTISMPRAAFTDFYIDLRDTYQEVRFHLVHACQAGKLEATTCERLAKAHEKALGIDKEVRYQLAHPERVVDGERIKEYLGVIIDLVKLAL